MTLILLDAVTRATSLNLLCGVLVIVAENLLESSRSGTQALVLRISATWGSFSTPHEALVAKDWSDGIQSYVVLSMNDVNITCSLHRAPVMSFPGLTGDPNELAPPEFREFERYQVHWILPGPVRQHPNGRIFNYTMSPEKNVLSLKNATKDDSGAYKCEARIFGSHGNERLISETVRLFVIRHPNQCKENWFHCHGKKSCVPPRFICDGREDCDDPSDESDEICGDACEGKLYCKEEGRCLAPEVCCPGLSAINCTPDVCCKYLPNTYSSAFDNEPVSRSFRPNGKGVMAHSNVDYLQTSVFIVMGCALAFVFITIALITSIYRFRLMRAVMLRTARHYSNNAARALAANGGNGPNSALSRNRHLDVVSWLPNGAAPGCGNFLVTYNINNGVQILAGRNGPLVGSSHIQIPPPPSYNEAIRSGGSGSGAGAARSGANRASGVPVVAASVAARVPLLRENVGPPPPYASRESLAGLGASGVGLEDASVSPSASTPLLAQVRQENEPPPFQAEDDAVVNGDNNGNNVESVEENNNHVMDRNHLSQ